MGRQLTQKSRIRGLGHDGTLYVYRSVLIALLLLVLYAKPLRGRVAGTRRGAFR